MQRAKVGLALGSGAAKGLAHIGVLKALTEHHIPVDAIAGSSIGSLVGALFAVGISPTYLEGLACGLHWRHLADFTVPKMGLIVGERIRKIIVLLTRGEMIEQAAVPLAIVATELMRRECVTFRTGSIADAVRASISIPGVFVPYVLAGGLYVDGGVLERVPIGAAYALGVENVIAVDVGLARTPWKPESMMDVMIQSLEVMQANLAFRIDEQPNITITPDLDDIGPSQFHKASQAIAAGYRATLKAMDEIRACLAKSEAGKGNERAIFHQHT